MMDYQCKGELMNMTRSVWSVVLLASIVVRGETNANKDEYDFFFDKLETIDDSGNVIKYGLQIENGDNGQFKVNGDLDQLQQLDNDWKLKAALYRMNAEKNEYTPMIAFPEMGVCEFMKTVYKSMLYEKIKSYSNAPHYETCPLPPKKYTVKDYPFDVKAYKNFLDLGQYRADMTLLKDERIEVGYQGFFHVNKKE